MYEHQSAHYPFPLNPLPYSYDALEPYIGRRTLHYHHDQHLKAYVEKLNQALEPYPEFHGWTLERLLLHLEALPEPLRKPVRQNAGGVYNHQLYFNSMTGVRSENAKAFPRFMQAAFGSYDEWKDQMKEAASSVFGSGWAWLVTDNEGGLSILKTSNQDTPLPLHPLLLVDVWEHAYYLQYQNRRPEYLENWFKLVNWRMVQMRYDTVFISGGRNREK